MAYEYTQQELCRDNSHLISTRANEMAKDNWRLHSIVETTAYGGGTYSLVLLYERVAPLTKEDLQEIKDIME